MPHWGAVASKTNKNKTFLSNIDVITEITYVHVPQSIQKAYTNWDYSNSSAHSLPELVENRTVLVINTSLKNNYIPKYSYSDHTFNP